MVQWLRLCTPKAGDVGSIPGCGIKISNASAQSSQKKENEKAIILCLTQIKVASACIKVV